MTEDNLKKLMAQLTIEEKLGQVTQVPISWFEGEGVVTGPGNTSKLSLDELYMAGSVLNVVGAKKVMELQKKYLEHSRLGIPLLFMGDIINGLKTVYPIPLAQACTFNLNTIQKIARICAMESTASGLHVTFSPMADLSRDARWGRVMESYGEDTFLTQKMAAAAVKGYQKEKLTDFDAVASCVKHFAAYGAVESGLEYNLVDMSEKRLREEYLPTYKKALDHAALVMAAFQNFNGVPVCANTYLLRQILREEWNYKGVCISDFGAVEELMTHGVAADQEEAAKRSLLAGIDMDMASGLYFKELKRVIHKSPEALTKLDQAVYRILDLKNKLGLFEHPYHGADEKREKEILYCKKFREHAQKAARESCVLLTNHGILPIPVKGKKVALIGPQANTPELCGAWSFYWEKDSTASLYSELKKKLVSLTYAAGCNITDTYDEEMYGQADYVKGNPEDMLEEAKKRALEADMIILTLGEHIRQSGEDRSRTNITISDGQKRLFDEIYSVNQNIVVVLFTGRPLVLGDIVQKASAILVAWHPGTEGAAAITELLIGEEAPSGKLAISFPRSVGQIPLYYSRPVSGRPFIQGKPKKFTSFYLDDSVQPQFPFGFGLSYTEFTVSSPKPDKAIFKKGDIVHISVTVRNVGQRRGTETVQCYVQDVVGQSARPSKELKGFQIVELDPQEEKRVTFSLNDETFAFWSMNHKMESEAGEFHIYVGTNSNVTQYISIVQQEEQQS